jgi:hypothetical protein
LEAKEMEILPQNKYFAKVLSPHQNEFPILVAYYTTIGLSVFD